jgi:hypothetical protein
MTIFGRFFWGTICTWVWTRHMKKEVIPYSKAKGYGREASRKALLRRMERGFDEVWPEDAQREAGND